VDAEEQWWQKGNTMTMDEYLDAEEAGTITTNMQEEREREQEQEQEQETAAPLLVPVPVAIPAEKLDQEKEQEKEKEMDSEAEMVLPKNWTAHWDDASGFYYYQNNLNFHTQWEKPLTEEQEAAEELIKSKQELEREQEKLKRDWSHVTGEVLVTRDLLQPLVGDKPRLTDKLLGRPPFRFIHDVVSAVTKATGFADGLFTEAQLDPTQVANKPAKLKYLNLIIRCVSIHLGVKVEAKANKIAAGHEVELTNKFLQFLAIAATSGESEYAVGRVLAGADEFDSTKPHAEADNTAANNANTGA